jgi:hypothetical protein
LGRFLQTDPVGIEDDLNLYGYVYNEPVAKTDPTGQMGAATVVAAPIIVGGVIIAACARNGCDELAQFAQETIRAAAEAVRNIVFNESAPPAEQPEGEQPTTVEDLASKGTPGRETSGRTTQTNMPASDSEADFDSLGGGETEVHDGDVKTKTLPTGETAVYRPETESRGATIVVQTRDKRGNVVRERKLRYPKQKWQQ